MPRIAVPNKGGCDHGQIKAASCKNCARYHDGRSEWNKDPCVFVPSKNKCYPQKYVMHQMNRQYQVESCSTTRPACRRRRVCGTCTSKGPACQGPTQVGESEVMQSSAWSCTRRRRGAVVAATTSCIGDDGVTPSGTTMRRDGNQWHYPWDPTNERRRRNRECTVMNCCDSMNPDLPRGQYQPGMKPVFVGPDTCDLQYKVMVSVQAGKCPVCYKNAQGGETCEPFIAATTAPWTFWTKKQKAGVDCFTLGSDGPGNAFNASAHDQGYIQVEGNDASTCSSVDQTLRQAIAEFRFRLAKSDSLKQMWKINSLKTEQDQRWSINDRKLIDDVDLGNQFDMSKFKNGKCA